MLGGTLVLLVRPMADANECLNKLMDKGLNNRQNGLTEKNVVS